MQSQDFGTDSDFDSEDHAIKNVVETNESLRLDLEAL